MNLRDLGERAAIRRLVAHYTPRRNALAFGDDCAAILLGDQYLLLTTDAVTAPTHFPPGTHPRDMGWFAAAVNFSDIASKGGAPLGLLMALGLPPDTDASVLDGIAEGAQACAEAVGAEILGGDTKPNPTLTLAGTAVGTVPRGELLRRAGARPGDVLAVTGSLGGAGAGFERARRGGAPGRLLHPEPRAREGRALATAGARACLDLSDGLALGAHDLAEAAGLGLLLDGARIPLHPDARADPGRGREWALHFGGDYELLAAVPPERWDAAAAAVADAGGALTALGTFTDAGAPVLLADEGGARALPRRGWEHFRPAP